MIVQVQSRLSAANFHEAETAEMVMTYILHQSYIAILHWSVAAFLG